MHVQLIKEYFFFNHSIFQSFFFLFLFFVNITFGYFYSSIQTLDMPFLARW